VRLTLTAQAFIDLGDISEFGMETWGEAAAQAYVDALTERLNQLIDFPYLGPPDLLMEGIRRLTIRRHVVFYKVMAEEIVIGRMLHATQDHIAHVRQTFP
jgi:toxin ParE1/3/4